VVTKPHRKYSCNAIGILRECLTLKKIRKGGAKQTLCTTVIVSRDKREPMHPPAGYPCWGRASRPRAKQRWGPKKKEKSR